MLFTIDDHKSIKIVNETEAVVTAVSQLQLANNDKLPYLKETLFDTSLPFSVKERLVKYILNRAGISFKRVKKANLENYLAKFCLLGYKINFVGQKILNNSLLFGKEELSIDKLDTNIYQIIAPTGELVCDNLTKPEMYTEVIRVVSDQK